MVAAYGKDFAIKRDDKAGTITMSMPPTDYDGDTSKTTILMFVRAGKVGDWRTSIPFEDYEPAKAEYEALLEAKFGKPKAAKDHFIYGKKPTVDVQYSKYTHELGGKTRVVYPICDSAAALVYFANQGGFVFHVWTSRREAPQYPDELVFDLDPPEGRFDLVQRTARLLHDLLDELALPVFVKTNGSKGLHVISPLDGRAAYDVVWSVGDRISKLLCARHPEMLTTEFYKKDRKRRLHLDTMRNAPGATIVAPYSLRVRPGAPVSAPIAWSELDTITPDGIRLRDVLGRLERSGDPWNLLRARLGSAVNVARSLERLTGL